MKYLLDTHLLLWIATAPNHLSKATLKILEDDHNECWFSAASLWEIVIKNGLGRADFHIEPNVFRRGLLDNGYFELAIKSEHTIMVGTLPPIHKDPFDRILIAQALLEGFILLTNDSVLTQYTGSIQLVQS